MAGSESSGSATYLQSETMALKSAEITVPARMMTTIELEPRPIACATHITMATAKSPQANENACTQNEDKPSKSAAAAPTEAPLDTPRISGETIGFLNMPW